jgi:predicted helicase
MELHIGYEQKMPYAGLETVIREVTFDSPPGFPPRLKADKEKGKILLQAQFTEIEISNIPPIAWEYKLGNRSALEWILDQYKEKTPKDPTIREKFNHYRFTDHICLVAEMLQKLVTVSVETMEIVGQMTSPASGHLS